MYYNVRICVIYLCIHVYNREGKKRRAFATKINKDEMKMPEIEKKPSETIEWILECVSDNLLFLKLDRDQKKE